MNYLVMDLTHGGVKIAISLAKKAKNVLAYDIYNTLNDIDRRMLEIYDVMLLMIAPPVSFFNNSDTSYFIQRKTPRASTSNV